MNKCKLHPNNDWHKEVIKVIMNPKQSRVVYRDNGKESAVVCNECDMRFTPYSLVTPKL